MKGTKKPNVSFQTNLLTSKEMIGSREKFPSPFLLLLEGAQQPVVSKHHLQTSCTKTCTCSYAHETERECRDREISRDKETQRQKRKKDEREREEGRGRLTF